MKGFDLNDVSGRGFEQLCRWFLLNDPIYGGQLNDVWLWDDWPGRWGRDMRLPHAAIKGRPMSHITFPLFSSDNSN